MRNDNDNVAYMIGGHDDNRKDSVAAFEHDMKGRRKHSKNRTEGAHQWKGRYYLN